MRTLALLLLLAEPASAADRVDPWSLVRLDLDVRVIAEPPALNMRGKAVVRLEAEQSGGPAFGINSRKRVMSLDSLTGDGGTATIEPFAPGSPILAARLDLARTFRRGDTLEVEFAAHSDEQSSQFVVKPEAVFVSWVESWYPVPARGPKELSPPSAPGTTTLRIPATWRSVSNGRRLSRTIDGGEAIEVWSSDAAVARSFVAAPFTDVETGAGRVSTYLLKPRSSITAQTEILERAIEAMERRFGPYPYDTYSIVEVPEDASFAAASEQGFIMVKGSLLDSPAGNLPLFAHEAAHGWWGNLVRPEGPGGKMLGEALAQYGAVLSIEALEGEAAASRFLRYSRENYNPLQCALGYFYIWREGGDRPLSQLATARWDHNLADSKGMWFYRMLRDEMGDEKFFALLRGIIRDYSNARLTLDAFRERLGPDLEPFLEQWLDRAGAPVLDLEWWSADRGRAVEIRIDQLQNGEPYQMPLKLLITTDSGERVTTNVKLCERQDSFFVLTPARPVSVVIDPEDRVLLWRPEYGPRPE